MTDGNLNDKLIEELNERLNEMCDGYGQKSIKGPITIINQKEQLDTYLAQKYPPEQSQGVIGRGGSGANAELLQLQFNNQLQNIGYNKLNHEQLPDYRKQSKHIRIHYDQKEPQPEQIHTRYDQKEPQPEQIHTHYDQKEPQPEQLLSSILDHVEIKTDHQIVKRPIPSDQIIVDNQYIFQDTYYTYPETILNKIKKQLQGAHLTKFKPICNLHIVDRSMNILKNILQTEFIENYDIQELLQILHSHTYGVEAEIIMSLVLASSMTLLRKLILLRNPLPTNTLSPYLNQIKHFINVMNFLEYPQQIYVQELFERCIYTYKCQNTQISEYILNNFKNEQLDFYLRHQFVRLNSSYNLRGIQWEIVANYINPIDFDHFMIQAISQHINSHGLVTNQYLTNYMNDNPQTLMTLYDTLRPMLDKGQTDALQMICPLFNAYVLHTTNAYPILHCESLCTISPCKTYRLLYDGNFEGLYEENEEDLLQIQFYHILPIPKNTICQNLPKFSKNMIKNSLRISLFMNNIHKNMNENNT